MSILRLWRRVRRIRRQSRIRLPRPLPRVDELRPGDRLVVERRCWGVESVHPAEGGHPPGAGIRPCEGGPELALLYGRRGEAATWTLIVGDETRALDPRRVLVFAAGREG